MPSIRRRGGQVVDEGLDIIPESELDPEPSAEDAAPAVSSADALPPDLLNAPVGMDDDLSHALAARPQRSKLPGLTAFLGAAVLVSAGFLGGVITQKHQGGTTGGGNAAAFAALRNRAGGTGAAAGGTGGAAAGGAALGGSGTTVGTVKLVDGNKIYVTASDGSTVVVDTGTGTTIKVSKAGKPSDLAPGSTVVVVGKAGADGVVKATSVTQGGTGGAGGGGFGGFGGFGGRTRGTGAAGTTGGSGG